MTSTLSSAASPASARSVPPTDPELAGPPPWYRTRSAWLLLLGSALFVYCAASFRFQGIAPGGLRNDTDLQFSLSKLVAEGSTPLIDFEHGWNAGGWYVGALLYRLTGGDAALWTFVWLVITGPVVAYTLVALAGIRLGLKTGVAFAAVVIAQLLSMPAHGKYAIPPLWMVILLPVAGVAGASQRRAVIARFAVVFVTLWLHVELAVLLSAGTAAYDLFGARGVALRARIQRVGALMVGGITAIISELLFFAAKGLGPGEVSRQVFLGQTEIFPEQYGFQLFKPAFFLLLIYPTAILLPFVPALWRRMGDATRFVVLLTVCLSIIPIRRVGLPHTSAVSTLLVFQYVLIARDLHASGWRPRWAGANPVKAGVGLLLGGAWAALTVGIGFTADSFLPVAVMIALCLVAVLASRRAELLWASTAAALVLLALPVAAVTNRNIDRVQGSQPLVEAQGMATRLKPLLAGCGVTDKAWIVPGPISLYDTLGVKNPTDYYLFHYLFAGEAERVVPLMENGSIPAIILPDGRLPNSAKAFQPVLEEHYRLCAETPFLAAPAPQMQIWTYVD